MSEFNLFDFMYYPASVVFNEDGDAFSMFISTVDGLIELPWVYDVTMDEYLAQKEEQLALFCMRRLQAQKPLPAAGEPEDNYIVVKNCADLALKSMLAYALRESGLPKKQAALSAGLSKKDLNDCLEPRNFNTFGKAFKFFEALKLPLQLELTFTDGSQMSLRNFLKYPLRAYLSIQIGLHPFQLKFDNDTEFDPVAAFAKKHSMQDVIHLATESLYENNDIVIEGEEMVPLPPNVDIPGPCISVDPEIAVKYLLNNARIRSRLSLSELAERIGDGWTASRIARMVSAHEKSYSLDSYITALEHLGYELKIYCKKEEDNDQQ